jgi:hypothetical protein
MDENGFKYAVEHRTSRLREYGYKIQQEAAPYSVELGKIPTTGVTCLIRFQLIPVSTVNRFQAILIRRRSEDFPLGEVRYKPLYMDVFNLILGLYKRKDIFPLGQYEWEYLDENSLVEQIANAQTLIIDYGIPWLEDPTSNIDWVKHLKGN